MRWPPDRFFPNRGCNNKRGKNKMAKLIGRRILVSFLEMKKFLSWRGLVTMDKSVSSVLDFWFNPNEPIQNRSKIWFTADPEFDEDIRKRFGQLVEKARAGELNHWVEHARPALAHIILLDQFCRNIFRGKPESFSHDHVALRIAEKLVTRDKEGHKSLAAQERCFAYLPLEHSENLDDQVKSVELFTELVQDSKGQDFYEYAKDNLEFAKQHKAVIERFGRFPKRNAVLGRASTPEEEQFLANNPYAF